MDYVPNTEAQLAEMLRAIGADSFAELIEAVPENIRFPQIDLLPAAAEMAVLQRMESLAAQNRMTQNMRSFLGAGAYAHFVPTAVDALASRGEWLTPYTPYQAEASQGILQAIYEFQSMVCQLMQMEVANASVYDGASAAAEAVVLALRATNRTRVLLSEALHPHVRQVIATYLSGAEITLQEIPFINGVTDIEALSKSLRDDVACVVMQQPNVFGCLEPMADASQLVHRFGGLFIASVYPISLGLIQPPGAYGTDIAVAEGRCLGTPLLYGGPALGLFTTTNVLVRRVPGRLAGCTVDGAGRRGFTLTLQTREQHIRREKATSNICTNEGWIALRAAIYLALIGPQGLRDLAQRNLDMAHYLYDRLQEMPWIRPAFNQPFFNEFTVEFDEAHPAATVARKLIATGFLPGFALSPWFTHLPQASVWCATELVSRADIDALVETLRRLS